MPKHPSRQPGPTGPVNSTGDDIAAFRLGQQAAFEPPPDGAAGGTQVTTLVSWWNHLVCSTCGHTFRRGDPVRHLAESDDICHVAPALRCGSPAQSAPPGDRPPVPSGQRPPEAADVRDFADGLAVTWPPGRRCAGHPAGYRGLADETAAAAAGARALPLLCPYVPGRRVRRDLPLPSGQPGVWRCRAP